MRRRIWMHMEALATVLFTVVLLTSFVVPTGTIVSRAPLNPSSQTAPTLAKIGSESIAATPTPVQIPGTITIPELTSHARTSLFADILLNGSNELVSFDASKSILSTVQVFPTDVAIGQVTSLGTRFLIELFHFDTGLVSFETFTPAAGVLQSSLPVNPTIFWNLLGTFAGDLYLYPYFGAAPQPFLQIDLATLTVVRDFGGLLPTNSDVLAMNGSGSSLYLGGNVFSSSPRGLSTSPFLAILHLQTSTLTLLSTPVSEPAGVFENVDSVVATDTTVFFGGEVVFIPQHTRIFDETSLGAILVAYSPGTGTLQDLSALLPPATSIQEMEPVGTTVALITVDFSVGSGLAIGGLFVLNPSFTGLVNDTSLTGVSFIVFFQQASESGGFVFLGGEHGLSGLSEFEAIPVSNLVP